MGWKDFCSSNEDTGYHMSVIKEWIRGIQATLRRL